MSQQIVSLLFLHLSLSPPDTQIEPAIGEPASEPFNLTGGLTYVGYGDLYLDILRAATTEGEEDVFDFLLA